MTPLADLAAYLDDYLRLPEIPDFGGAMNGVQLENSGEVTRIAAAVDAHLPVIEAAVETGANLLLVHHGLFWQGAQRIRGPLHRKLKLAMDHDLAIFSAHHPLDAHPEVGNNACIARALDLEGGEPFFYYKAEPIGLRFAVDRPRSELAGALEEALGGPVHLCPGGPGTVKQLGICSGGAGGEIGDVAAAGIDTFITGEGPHWSYTAAEELGVNVLYGGHYATETFGVKALAAHLADRFQLTWDFIDHPTGM